MTYTHAVLTKSTDGNLRIIQPFDYRALAFGETPDGGVVAYYSGAKSEELKEPFVHIMRQMIASGMALDCTGASDHVGGDLPAFRDSDLPNDCTSAPKDILSGEMLPIENYDEHLRTDKEPTTAAWQSLKKQLAAKDEQILATEKELEHLRGVRTLIYDMCGELGSYPVCTEDGIKRIFKVLTNRQEQVNRLTAQIDETKAAEEEYEHLWKVREIIYEKCSEFGISGVTPTCTQHGIRIIIDQMQKDKAEINLLKARVKILNELSQSNPQTENEELHRLNAQAQKSQAEINRLNTQAASLRRQNHNLQNALQECGLNRDQPKPPEDPTQPL